MKRTALAIALSALAAQAAAMPVLLNTSFESNNITAPPYFFYAGLITAAPWTFTGGSGVTVENAAWGAATASGYYYAFLQSTSSISQVFNSDGDYNLDISFDLVERPGYATTEVVEVLLDGVLQSTIDPTAGWTSYNLLTVAITAGSHTLEFRGHNPFLTDATALLDHIQMTATPSVPEPAILALLGLGLAGLGLARRRRA